jgi:hypothetical protein
MFTRNGMTKAGTLFWMGNKSVGSQAGAEISEALGGRTTLHPAVATGGRPDLCNSLCDLCLGIHNC